MVVNIIVKLLSVENLCNEESYPPTTVRVFSKVSVRYMNWYIHIHVQTGYIYLY